MPQTNSRMPAGQIVGFDVDLMNAIARTLGLVPEYRETAFEAIIPSVRAATSTSGCRRSPTPRSARSRPTSSRTSRRARCGRNGRVGGVDPNNACGLSVGVAVRRLCKRPRRFRRRAMHVRRRAAADRQGGVRQPGRSDRSADQRGSRCDVGGFAGDVVRDQDVAAANWKPAGEVFDSAPYGWPVAKGSGLARIAAEGARTPDPDRRVQDHRDDVGCREGHDRHTDDQRRDQVTATSMPV